MTYKLSDWVKLEVVAGLCSVLSICVQACMFVNMLTLEPFEISS